MSNDYAGMIMFRKSGKGYNKDDVNKYIEEMNIRFKTEVDSLKSRLDKLSYSAPSTDNISEAQISALQGELEQLKLMNKAISDENKRLNELLQKQSEKEESVSAPNSAAESVQSAEKYAPDGKNTSDDPFVNVKVKADQILSDADVAARLITDRVQKHLSTMTDNYESVLLTGALESLKDIEESFLNARVKVKEIQFRMEDTLRSISSDPASKNAQK